MPIDEATLPPPDAIRRAASEVVARPYYKLGSGVADDSEPIIIEILRWIMRPFRWMFDSMEGLPEVVRWLVVILCVVLCAALISHIVYTLVMAIRGPVLRRRQEFASTVREVDASDLERQAELSGGRGDYIGAVRLLFRAALRRIELSEQRKFRPGITNRELLRRYRATPLADSLARFVETIELKWYGNYPCEQADFQACLGEHGRICQHVERIEQRESAVGA